MIAKHHRLGDLNRLVIIAEEKDKIQCDSKLEENAERVR
jgi:hypothetical protein